MRLAMFEFDEYYFAEKSLIIFEFWRSTASIFLLDIVEISIYGASLLIELTDYMLYFSHNRVVSYYAIIIEVSKENIIGIDSLKVKIDNPYTNICFY